MNEISRGQIERYFELLQGSDTQIDWRVIKEDQFEALSPGRHAGLQISDVVAGAFHCPEHICASKRTSRWAEMLKPMMYRSRAGKYRGYGLKLFPSEAESRIAQGTLAPWANDIFQA